MSPRLRTALPLVAASAILLAACSSTTANPPAASPDAPEAASASPATSQGAAQAKDSASAPAPAAPSPLDFTGTTITGAAFNGADLAGKPVVLWFWAPWCTVCRAESPDVAKVAAEFDGRITFVGVGSRGPADDMRAFVDETGTGGFTHVADVPGSVWARFGIVAQPSFVFVTPDGQAQAFTGSLNANELRDVASQLLAL